MIFARDTNLIADIALTIEFLDFRGASGLKPCPKCANGVMKGSLSDADHPLPNPDNVLVKIIATTLRDVVPNTNEAVWESVDELKQMNNLYRDQKMPKDNFEFAQKAFPSFVAAYKVSLRQVNLKYISATSGCL